MGLNSHLEDHVDTIARHEEQFLANRTHVERLSDSVAIFIGSLYFVGIHILGFSLWILVNTFPQRGHHLDPYPFPLLDTMVAMEAIFLASFILMRQGRLAKRADERDHLMLQVLLLAERETSAVVRINQRIAEKLGLEDVANDSELRELGRHTSIDGVAQTIQDKLGDD